LGPAPLSRVHGSWVGDWRAFATGVGTRRVVAVDRLDEIKNWLALHNDAVMAVLLLVVGVNLIAKGVPPLT
jgi:hypothetical protein